MTKLNIDEKLVDYYGSYASFTTPSDPAGVNHFGDSHVTEIDRLLDQFSGSDVTLLDLGCGAGQTLCRVAPQVQAIWGFDENEELLSITRQRVAKHGLSNATLVLGNVAEPEDIARLPDNTFDLVLSRRGPDINESLLPKLKTTAVVIQELYQSPLGLNEIFGREAFLPQVSSDPHWLIKKYKWLGLLPVSVKDYFFEQYFRDTEHLAEYLSKRSTLGHWRMPLRPFDPQTDQLALSLYARYNTTPQGIRLLGNRKVYLFRRTPVAHFPAYPDLQPLYPG